MIEGSGNRAGKADYSSHFARKSGQVDTKNWRRMGMETEEREKTYLLTYFRTIQTHLPGWHSHRISWGVRDWSILPPFLLSYILSSASLHFRGSFASRAAARSIEAQSVGSMVEIAFRNSVSGG